MDGEFFNGQPYCAIAGELVADAVALLKLVTARRPEIGQIGGAVHLTFDARNGVVLVGLQQENGNIVLVERILVDTSSPATFGAPELPVVEEKTRTH
jgi:hypothetical protein